MASTIYTEDQVRDLARTKLHLEETESAQAGVQSVGFPGSERPSGWMVFA